MKKNRVRISCIYTLSFEILVWGYGFLCVTLINLCAVIGMVFLPLMKKSFYTKLLMFMVALAVGTLAGSSLLFLIPEVSTYVLSQLSFALTMDSFSVLELFLPQDCVVKCFTTL